MRRTLESSVSYNSIFFAEGNARLWDIGQDLYVYLLVYSLDPNIIGELEGQPVLTYQDEIFETTHFDKKRKAFVTSFYFVRFKERDGHNKRIEIPLIAVEVQKLPNNGGYLAGTCEYRATQRKIRSSRPPLENVDQFSQYHKTHLERYYAALLLKSEPLKMLSIRSLELKKKGNTGNEASKTKHEAIETLLNTLRSPNFDLFFSILDNPQNECFIEIIKPIPNEYKSPFFHLVFTKITSQSTRSFAHLSTLKASALYLKSREVFQNNPPPALVNV